MKKPSGRPNLPFFKLKPSDLTPQALPAPGITKKPLDQEIYDRMVKLSEAVDGKGAKPYCRVCSQPFVVGQPLGWTYSSVAGNYIAVHDTCHLKAITKPVTAREVKKVKRVMRGIFGLPCNCDLDVIVQAGCQCGGI